MKGRIIFIVLVLAAAIGVVVYMQTRPVSEIVLTGIVTTDNVIVSAQVQGRVEQLLVNQGNTVKRGQLLAVIQQDQYQADVEYYQSNQQQAATQVSQAEAELRYQELQTRNQIVQAQANLDAAEAQQAAAQATLKDTELVATQEEQAYERHAETVQARDQAVAQRDAQRANVKAAGEQVNAVTAALALAKSNEQQNAVRKAAVEASEHQLAAVAAQTQKAGVQLDYTEIRAPIDGFVDARTALQGEIVNPAQAIVTLVDPNNLWVRADVEESYIDRIHKGDKMEVRLPSGATRTGAVIYIAADADYATQRDVSRTKRDIKTFEIRLHCDNSDGLALGMTAYVVLPLVK